jgi:hypothetical protein
VTKLPNNCPAAGSETYIFTALIIAWLAAVPPPSTSGATAKFQACPHRYFPIEEGLRLTYRAGNSRFQVSFSDVKKTPQGVKGNLEVSFKEKTGSTEATCSKEGVKTGMGGIEGTALQSSGLDVKVLSSEGVAFPPLDQMTPGRPWTNKLALELKPPKNVKMPGGFSPVITTRFERESEVIGTESVEVAGEKFEALKVKNKTTAGSTTGGSDRTVESMMWLAPGIGIVKIATGDSVDLELLSIDRTSGKPGALGAR